MDFERIPRLEYELPYQRECRLCRASFRSKRKQALCETCRFVIASYDGAVTTELQLANITAVCYPNPLVQNARAYLACPDCGWDGNQSGIADSSWESGHGRKKRRRYKRRGGRKEPRTVLGFLAKAPDYAERMLAHQRRRHWTPKPAPIWEGLPVAVQGANSLNDVVARAICPKCHEPIGRRFSVLPWAVDRDLDEKNETKAEQTTIVIVHVKCAHTSIRKLLSLSASKAAISILRAPLPQLTANWHQPPVCVFCRHNYGHIKCPAPKPDFWVCRS